MTPASDEHPTVRLCVTRYETYVVEVRQDTIVIRPKGTRRGGASEIAIGVGPVYQRALLARNK